MSSCRTTILVASALAVLTVAAGEPRETSETYSAATYREREGRIVMLVESFQASLHDEDAYVPIPVAIGLRGKGPGITITPESFTLIDQDGNAYPAADYGDLLRDYRKLTFDRHLLESRPLVVGNLFEPLYRLPSRFYPAVDDGVRIPRVNLARFTWFADVIYFPRPAGGLGGVLTLRLDGREIDPVDVRFRVPLRGAGA